MARHKEEIGRPFTVRIRSAALADLEAWMVREGEAGLSHQKAILRLVAAGVHDGKKSPNIHGVTKISDVTKERAELKIAKLEVIKLEAERDALRDEVADLRRQLAERVEPPAQPSPLDLLSPVARAEFEHWRATKLAGRSDAEALAAISDKFLLSMAKKRAAPAVAQPPAPAPPVVEKAPPRKTVASIAATVAATRTLTAAEKLDLLVEKDKAARLARRETRRD